MAIDWRRLFAFHGEVPGLIQRRGQSLRSLFEVRRCPIGQTSNVLRQDEAAALQDLTFVFKLLGAGRLVIAE